MTLVAGKLLVKEIATEEDFTILVDPAIASDPEPIAVITNQVQATGVGTFKTVNAAIEALPNVIRHWVTIEIAAGDHTLDGDYLGHLARFIFEPTPETGIGNWTAGAIVYTSEGGNIRETATSTYAVASGTRKQIVLTADPGFSVDEHQGKFLRVVSGTGAGQVRPIRDHSGTTFNSPGRWVPLLDATSVVEIVRPATKVKDSSYGWAGIRGNGNFFPWVYNVIIKEIELYTDTAGGQLALENSTFTLDHCRILYPGMEITHAELFLDGSVHDGQGMLSFIDWPGVSMMQLSNVNMWNNSYSAAMFRNSPHSGISVGLMMAGSNPSNILLNGFTFDDLDGDAMKVCGAGNYLGLWPALENCDAGPGVLGFCVHALWGGRVYVDWIVGPPSIYPTGGTKGVVGVDDIPVTQTEIEEAGDQIVIGPYGSIAGYGYAYV